MSPVANVSREFRGWLRRVVVPVKQDTLAVIDPLQQINHCTALQHIGRQSKPRQIDEDAFVHSASKAPIDLGQASGRRHLAVIT
jgi:hypothetical protein